MPQDKPQYLTDVEWILQRSGMDYMDAQATAKKIVTTLLDSKSFLKATTETLTPRGFEMLQEHAKTWHTNQQSDSPVINDR